MSYVLEGEGLTQDYHIPGGLFGKARVLRAVKGASFRLEKGRTLAIVGESGSGKSTLARIIALIDRQSGGTLKITGETVDIGRHRPKPSLRSKVQMVFQNPYGSLNPRQKVGDVLMEPLLLNTDLPAPERRARAEAMLAKVGLAPEHFNRYPHMFSGGQRQRIAIARAMILRPRVVVLDEPTSALDMTVQVQIVELLRGLQRRHGLAYLFISHDLRVVRALAHQVMVMKRGDVVEQGSAEEIFAQPKTAYTKDLIAAALGEIV